MHAEELGAGPPVVLVHGLGAYSISWKETALALSSKYSTYAVDLLGFGKSPAPAGFAYTAKAQADAVVDFIKAKKLSNPIIVGHSMGGSVCLHLADMAAQGTGPSLSKMILIGPVASPPGASPASALIAEISAMIDAPGFSAASASALGTLVAKSVLENAYLSAPPPPQIGIYAAGLSSAGQLRAFVRHSQSLNGISFSDKTLRGIMTETLVITGDSDTFVEPARSKKLAETLGNAAPLETITGCGHIPQEEKADKTKSH